MVSGPAQATRPGAQKVEAPPPSVASSPEPLSRRSSSCDLRSPLKEVPLSTLHKRCESLGVTFNAISHSLDSARRLDAFEWLVQAFDALGASDVQLINAFGLLDRFAAASPTPVGQGPTAFALVLAAMLVALKVGGTQRDVERAKRLVVEVAGDPKPWEAVRRAEFQLLRRLSFRTCCPTPRDLLDRLLAEALPDSVACDPDLRSQCEDLAHFLLELGIVHEPEVLYGNGRPPLTAALAALSLSLLSLDVPLECQAEMSEALRIVRQLGGNIEEQAEAMRRRWASEEQRAARGNVSAVFEKWAERVRSLVPPPAPSELRRITSMVEQESTPLEEETRHKVAEPSLTTPRGALTQTSSTENLRAGLFLAASVDTGGPPPSRRGTSQPPADRHGGAAEMDARPLADISHAPSGARQVSAVAKGPVGHLMRSPEGQPLVELSRLATGSRHGGATARGCVACANARSPGLPASLDIREALNFVLPRPHQVSQGQNMPVTTPERSGGHGSIAMTSAGKQKQLTVAAELLVSSSLRLQWPSGKRKLSSAEVAIACRDAVAALQEASANLLSAAATLESSAAPPKELKAVAGLETKRRRTFGGPSPTQAVSPARGPLAPRNSPPVRFGGLRV